MYLLFGLYFVIGIVIGSFLNVCIYRLPLGKSVISPPSACGSCGHRLGALDMIPVLSYFLLRGRCRYCNAAYSARYMLVELLTGILFALCGLYYLPGLKIILVFFFVACLIVQAFIDLDHQILLDEILMLMLPTGIIYAYYALPDMWDSLYGALFAGGSSAVNGVYAASLYFGCDNVRADCDGGVSSDPGGARTAAERV